MKYKVLVVWNDGEEEYLAQGDKDAEFATKKEADDMVAFMKIGMEGCQSINVVRE